MADKYEKELLKELERVTDSAMSEVLDERVGLTMDKIRIIEEHTYKSFGTSEKGYIFRIFMAGHSREEVDEHLLQVPDENKIDLDENYNAAIGVELMEETDDINRSLSQYENGILLANAPDNVGFMIRVGAYRSAKALTEGVKPSDASDKEDCLITVCLTANRCYSIIRTPDNEIIEQVIESSDYEAGEQKLVDAMLKFFVEPTNLKQNNPAVFTAMVTDIQNKHNNNNKGE